MFQIQNRDEQDTGTLEQNLKQKWLPFQIKDTQIAVQTLNKLKNEVQKLMISFNEQGFKFIEDLDVQIEYLKTKSSQIGKLICELPNNAYQEPQKINQMISEQLIEVEKIQEMCKYKLRTLIDSEILNKCFYEIQQLNFNDTIKRLYKIFNPLLQEQNQNWICEKHKKQIKFVQLNGEISNKLACDQCIQNNRYGQYITLQELQFQWNRVTIKTLKKYNYCQHELLKNSNGMLFEIQSLRQNFKKLLEQINLQLNCQNTLESDQLQQQYQMMQIDWLQLSTAQLIDVAYICSQQNFDDDIEKEFKTKNIFISQMLNETKKFSNMLKIQYESFLKYWIKPIDNNIQNEEINESKNEANPQKYQLLEQYNMKEEKCLSFAFNGDSSILVVGYNRFIKVFQFQQGQLTQTQILDDHKDYIRCLYFMNRSNQFISGCNDFKIIIWSCDSNNYWYAQQVLEGHTDYVRAGVIMNNREDLIISGSDDRTIRFWSKKNRLWSCKQILSGHSKEVRSLSLNPSSTQLISCSAGTQIFLTQYSPYSKQWCNIQIIQTEKSGYSLKFIKEDLFSFQPYDQGILQIYQLDSRNRTFQIIQNLQVKSKDNRWDFFPQQFIEDKSILLHKNGNTINIFKFNRENNQFTIVQSIPNSDVYLYGALTADAQYLVTWDTDSRCIRVRKYQQ
ncbi:unnamed protein product [Paramecium sonneborni]|uniref:WD domain, G-beta repeat protein n=1 Tax=Paramecium sonneborni TaxID=65129 RepID=A0A8S1M6H5_9CILI|nr:unnamed protein product [Paramecium sonneborni]